MAKTQIDLLADYIMAEIPGEPSASEGAGDTAIRIITQLKADLAKYGGHTAECGLSQWYKPIDKPKCDCGFAEAQERWG